MITIRTAGRPTLKAKLGCMLLPVCAHWREVREVSATALDHLGLLSIPDLD
jgi:hypothetical protein